MTLHAPAAETSHTDSRDTGTNEPAAKRPAAWSTPDYQVVETSLEVTAYFGVEI